MRLGKAKRARPIGSALCFSDNPAPHLPCMTTLTAPSAQPEPTRHALKPCAGFGLGLRTPHYSDFLASQQPLDWLEIITDNFLVEGGKPLVMLERIRRDYPMAMHGVAMSIGAAGGIDEGYVRKVKALADRIEPMWVSDHLCWTGLGPEHLHDLYPMPYTDEAARHVVEQIRRAQDILQRPLVLENVSSYIDFKHNAASEWQFLAYIAQAADCKLLVDVNNIYVSSVNHRFDPLEYLQALPAHRVQQIHLAGHSDHGHYIVDTHDNPVTQAVWDLYAKACQRFGPVATMIERDDNIPPLPVLIEELGLARSIAANVFDRPATTDDHKGYAGEPGHSQTAQPAAPPPAAQPAVALAQVQQRMHAFILGRPAPLDAPMTSLVADAAGVDAAQRLGIYHHAYRARLAEVLADSFAKTVLYMGSSTFEQHARDFAVSHPPMSRSLSRYGADFPAYLAALYPGNPELSELAQLDWDLRTRFDGPDVPALSAQSAQAATDGQAPPWLHGRSPLHPSLLLRRITTNVTQIWRAIDADEDVPEVHHHAPAKTLAVWRKALQPNFQTLDGDEAAFMQRLLAGSSIDEAANALAGTEALPDPQRLGGWLHGWLEGAMLRQDQQQHRQATPEVAALATSEQANDVCRVTIYS
jgi:uncharacterized protein (UPF0276 family)